MARSARKRTICVDIGSLRSEDDDASKSRRRGGLMTACFAFGDEARAHAKAKTESALRQEAGRNCRATHEPASQRVSQKVWNAEGLQGWKAVHLGPG